MIQKLALLLPDSLQLVGHVDILLRVLVRVLFGLVLVEVRPDLPIDLIHVGDVLLKLLRGFILQLCRIL